MQSFLGLQITREKKRDSHCNYGVNLHNDSNASLADWGQGNHSQDSQQKEKEYHQVANKH